MGYLTQASSSVADNHALTVSCWMRVPTASYAQNKHIYLCEFGHPNSGTVHSWKFMVQPNNGFNDSTAALIVINGSGRLAQYTIGGDPYHAEVFWNSGDIPRTYIAPDKWFLLQIAMDWSVGTFRSGAPIGTGMGTVLVVLNGVAVPVGPFGQGISYESEPVKDTALVVGDWTGLSQPFNMPFNSLPFGMPGCYPSFSVGWEAAEYAHFNFWAGTAFNLLDPGVAAAFYGVSGGVATPKSVITTANLLGQQTHCFSGRASDGSFYINRGTGGDFVLTGTVADFTPGPTFT